MNNTFSKPVLAVVVLLVALTGFIIWSGTHRKPVAETQVAESPVVPPVVAVPAGSTVSKPAPAAKKVAAISPEAATLSVIPVSLTNLLIPSEINVDSAMKSLPTGTQTYGGIEFWLQGLVQLQSLATRDEQRKEFRTSIVVPLDETNLVDGKVSVNERGKNIASIYILAGTRFSANNPQQRFADVLWHFADGTAARSSLQYNVHLRDWARKAYEDPPQLPNALTKVAWKGPHPTRKDRSLRLYRVALVNPHPEKIIHSLEFASAMARPSLFVVALTLDPLMPGARPDDLTSEEMADPELHGHLDVLVVDSDNHPLPNSTVALTVRTKANGYMNRKFTTDDTGTAHLKFDDTDLDTLDVTAEHDGFSGRKMIWSVSGGDVVPANYTLKLGVEVQIGGIVVNEEGNPVSEADVRLYRFWRGNDDDPNKPGEQAAFTSHSTKTDAAGRWQLGGLPATLLGNIGFNVVHPDYLRGQDNVGENSATEKSLRDGTYKTILKRGLIVRGRVFDAVGNPVPAATVTAGRRYYSDTKTITADADGTFAFNNIKEGETLMSVVAKGFAATSKNVVVATNMPEVVFNLSAGSVLRGHVQDETGKPVTGAQVGLENNGMDGIENAIDFSARTDANGDFSWDGAPNQTLTFYVFHDGFESKRDAKVSPNQNNVITLRRSRTLSGVVLDESSGQPVTKFTVRTGKAIEGIEDVYGIIRYKNFSAADGHFTMSMEEEEDNAVLVMADGYTDKVERFPASSDKIIQVTVRMKPAASLAGIVLGPDGAPAPGVSVTTSSGAGSPRHYVELAGRRLRSHDSATKVATTDDQGRFKLGTIPDDGLLVAAGDAGFTRVPLAEVKNNPTVTLQAWGRIEGVLHSGGQPAAGKELLFNLDIPGISTDFNAFKVTTDEQGKFTMEKLPPGDGKIVRLIRTTPNSWTHSDAKDVTVKPGETTQVTLGDDGAVITGRYRYTFQPTNDAPLQLQGNISLQVEMPQIPSFTSQAEAQAFFNTPEWQAAAKRQKYYSLELKPDGTFTAENVIPGNYSLHFDARVSGDQAWRNPPVAQGNAHFTVPETFNPSQPIDVGEVELNAVPPPPSSPQMIWR